MAYMLLVVEPVGQRVERGLEAGQAAYAQMMAFAGSLQADGVLLSCNALASLDGASRVSIKDGRRSVLDGPFAETKEMVGGYFLLDVATHADAVAIAARCPAAAWCTVEVRRVATCYE